MLKVTRYDGQPIVQADDWETLRRKAGMMLAAQRTTRELVVQMLAAATGLETLDIIVEES